MSVSLYYSAHRAEPPTAAESGEIARVNAAHQESFPYQDQESRFLHDDPAPDELLAGFTKMLGDPERMLAVLVHVLGSLTELRRALPGAEWRVHLDDLDVPWDEDEGYAVPGMRDPGLAAELGGP
ncbi:hypothetical protein ACFXKD_02165 [Nocardiopsis aegyptia]|uniref:hypothetical protein n=1 Tax=Nocardiopsis aegyptia TaxID=220378 RepID=UPI003670A174